MNYIWSPKLAGPALIIGSILLLGGLVLHRITTEVNQEIGAEALARIISDNIIMWYASHTMFTLSSPILILGFLTLYGVLSGKDERIYSLPAILSLGLFTVLFTATFVMHGFHTPILAENYLAASAGAKQSAGMILESEFLLNVSWVLVGVFALSLGVGLLGASLVRAKLYNKVFAWAGVVIGLLGVLGFFAGFFGPFWVFTPIFALYFLILVVWSIALGIFLYRG